jgi:hypothetical protein
VIAHCRMGHRASFPYFALHELFGYKNVKVYDGSWTEWRILVSAPIERRTSRSIVMATAQVEEGLRRSSGGGEKHSH